MANYGHMFETQFLESLNNKTIMALAPNLKWILERIFGTLSPIRKVQCIKADDFIKPDVVVTYHHSKAFISLKTGTACEVHREKIETFIPFLRDLGISEYTLKTIALFQFGDMTYDGSGTRRMDTNEIYTILKDRIMQANEELNRDKETMQKIIYRLIFKGVCDAAAEANYIYHGSLSDGVLISKRQIEKYINKKDFTFLANLHIGPLLLRPHARYAGVPVKNEVSRREITFYWPNFRADLEYIDKRFGI